VFPKRHGKFIRNYAAWPGITIKKRKKRKFMKFPKSVMKSPKTGIYLIYLVLPVILFCYSPSWKKARGPYFIGPNYDPEYAYLLGSLNAANFKTSNLTVHPGTPVQVIGGIVLRAHDLINYRDLQKDVLKRPEYYLSRLNYVILAVNVIMLIIIGMAAFFLTGDILPGLIIQATPFLSRSILGSLTRFNPEPFLFFAGLLLISVILIKTLKTTKSGGNNREFIFIFALIGGLGLAVKIPFLPLLVIPLFLFKKLSSMLKYLALAFAAFLLFLLPYYHRIIYYFGWLWDVARHAGKYGQGKAGIMDFSTLLPNINLLFRKEPLFMYTLLLLTAFIGINLLVPRLRKPALKSIVFKALLGIFAANIIALTMILKHFALKYLLAGFCLTGLAAAFIYMYGKDMSKEWGFSPRPVKFSFIFIFILAGLISYRQLPNLEYIAKKRDKKLAVYEKFRREYKNYKKIFYYGSTSKWFALSFGNRRAAFYHSPMLASIYGSDVYFYNIYKGAFFNWHKKVGPAEVLADPGNTVMFGPEITAGKQRKSILNMTRHMLAKYNLKLVKPMPDNRGETIFTFEKIKPPRVLIPGGDTGKSRL
jgi:hypothetical protein